MATHDFIVINRYPGRMLKTERSRVIDSANAAVEA
jgi:cell division transport system ATP-binding protein